MTKENEDSLKIKDSSLFGRKYENDLNRKSKSRERYRT